MTVLLVGGAGYIGSHTAKVLAAEGMEAVVLDNLSTGNRWSVRWSPFVQGDLSDGPLVRRVLEEFGITTVIHLAANAYVGESMNDPRKYFRNNVANSLELLDAMLDAGVHRIVFSSSCTVYGPPETLPLREDHPRRPMNPYGESKQFVERALHWYGQAYGLSSVALRYFNAAGADPDGEIGECHSPETHLVPLAIEAALGRHPSLDVLGTDYPTPDGSAIRDYTHVTDIARAHVLAVRYLEDSNPSCALNLGTGRGSSVFDVLQAVEAAGDRNVPFCPCPRRPGDPPELVADATRAREILGWSPAITSIEEIAATAWSWHASSGAGR
jgi:UDP-glucose-4-epimerase GalE